VLSRHLHTFHRESTAGGLSRSSWEATTPTLLAPKPGYLTDPKDAMRNILCLITVLLLTLAVAASASAQSSVEGYEDQAGQIQAQIQNGGGSGGGGASGTAPVTATTDSSSSGSLPFTGLDVALLLAAGGVLAAAGLGMRRLTRSPGSA
jgi:hypothetical protein